MIALKAPLSGSHEPGRPSFSPGPELDTCALGNVVGVGAWIAALATGSVGSWFGSTR